MGRKKHNRDESRKQNKTDYSTYRFNLKEGIVTLAAGAAAGLAVVWICYNSWYALPVIIPVICAVIHIRRENFCSLRVRTLEAHFREFLSALYSNLAAGYSLENSVRSAWKDMEKLYGEGDHLVRELKQICREMSIQIPVERLFYEFGMRSCSEDIRTFGEVLMIVKRTGGSMDQVLKSCRRTIGDRIDTRQEIDTIISAKRYEQRLMSVMPAGIILYLRLSFGDFMSCLYGNITGVMIMTAALGVYLAAFYLGTRMVRIEV